MPSQVERALERAGSGGVFYLHGDDEFRKLEAVRALVERHVDEGTRAFNYDLVRGGDTDVERLASLIATPPLMAAWRVVDVRDVQAFAGSASAREVLVGAAENPPAGLALILSATVPSGSKARFYRDLESKARALRFNGIVPNDVPDWLVQRAHTLHEVEVEVDAARALGGAIGTDLGVLAQELEKLVEFVGDRRRVTREDVEAAGTVLPEQDRWRWFDFVGERRFAEALEGLPVLLAQGESAVRLVADLGTHLLRLGVAASEGPDGLRRVLGGRASWLSGRLLPQARRWSADQIGDAVRGLLRADRLLKSSGLSHELLLEEWLLTEMVRARELAAAG